MEEKTNYVNEYLSDNYRHSTESVIVELPRWIEASRKVFGIEKKIRFWIDPGPATASVLCRYLLDRGSVDYRHKEHSKAVVEETKDAAGKVVSRKTIMVRTTTDDQIKALNEPIPIKLIDFASTGRKAREKKPLTKTEIVAAISSGKLTAEDLKAILADLEE